MEEKRKVSTRKHSLSTFDLDILKKSLPLWRLLLREYAQQEKKLRRLEKIMHDWTLMGGSKIWK